jgi:two-component system sensor histidine kinase DctS
MSKRILLPSSVRWLLPVVLVLLFLAIIFWLPWQARQLESNERQEQLIADTLWVEQSIRFQLGRHEESLRGLANEIASGHLPLAAVQQRMGRMLKNGAELKGVIQVDPEGRILASSEAAAPARAALGQASLAAQDGRRGGHRRAENGPAFPHLPRRAVAGQPGGDLPAQKPARRNGALVVCAG